jgi:hypothetical protein
MDIQFLKQQFDEMDHKSKTDFFLVLDFMNNNFSDDTCDAFADAIVYGLTSKDFEWETFCKNKFLLKQKTKNEKTSFVTDIHRYCKTQLEQPAV